MDELELLKKDWKRKEASLPRFDAETLYAMLQKKSHSITKWIFLVGIAELALWTALNFLVMNSSMGKKVELVHLNMFSDVMTVLTYVVSIVFIILFYKNYKSISVTDNARQLMKAILRTRRVVKIYVLYQLIMGGLLFLFTYIYTIFYFPKLTEIEAEDINYTGLIIIGVGLTIGCVGLLWLFYKLIYGLFLKKLKKNYQVLKKMELQDE